MPAAMHVPPIGGAENKLDEEVLNWSYIQMP